MALLLTEPDVAACLDMPSLIPAMREALIAFSTGKVVQPVRQSLAIRPHGVYGVMPAHVPANGGGGVFGLKSVSVFTGNEQLGLPSHLAHILLLDDTTGALIAIMDGRLVTEMRTAAVSAVSVQALARPSASRLAILGSGVQAHSHLKAISEVRTLESVSVWSRTASHAEKFARDHASDAPGPIRVAKNVEEAVDGADIIVTVTHAHEPVLYREWISPGAHLCVVGSSHPRHREVDTATVLDSHVYVDSRAAAAVEAGDLLIPVAEEEYDLDWIEGELGEALAGETGRVGDQDITLFKSLGIGVEDIATARLVVERAREKGVGAQIML
jgi:ornithine cyclodeaminase